MPPNLFRMVNSHSLSSKAATGLRKSWGLASLRIRLKSHFNRVSKTLRVKVAFVAKGPYPFAPIGPRSGKVKCLLKISRM